MGVMYCLAVRWLLEITIRMKAVQLTTMFVSVRNVSVVATVFGIIIGPYALGIFNPTSWSNYDNVTLEFTRIVIAVQVMAAGVSLPR